MSTTAARRIHNDVAPARPGLPPEPIDVSDNTAALAGVQQVIDAAAPFDATWESLQNYRAPLWYQDGKFGIFLHWGVFSVPAFEDEWYSRNMYLEGSKPFEHPGGVGPGSSVPTSRRAATVSTACARTPLRPEVVGARRARPIPDSSRGTSRPGSAPTRGSRRVIPVAQLADGISQFGMSPRIQW